MWRIQLIGIFNWSLFFWTDSINLFQFLSHLNCWKCEYILHCFASLVISPFELFWHFLIYPCSFDRGYFLGSKLNRSSFELLMKDSNSIKTSSCSFCRNNWRMFPGNQSQIKSFKMLDLSFQLINFAHAYECRADEWIWICFVNLCRFSECKF